MSEKFDHGPIAEQQLKPGSPAQVIEASLIPEDMRKALNTVGLVPGKNVLVIATGISEEGSDEPIAYVGPTNISERDLRDFNMEEFMTGARFQSVTAMPLRYLKPLRLN